MEFERNLDLTIWLFDGRVRQGKLAIQLSQHVLLNAIVLVHQFLAYSFMSNPVQISVRIFLVIRQS